jgi:uncharacterized protein YrrD
MRHRHPRSRRRMPFPGSTYRRCHSCSSWMRTETGPVSSIAATTVTTASSSLPIRPASARTEPVSSRISRVIPRVTKDFGMTARFELHEGAHVVTAEGDDLGTVREFVVEPSSRDFTHLLVEKGVFFTDDRIVPIETIDRVEDDEVILREDVDPATLPRFVREHYTALDEETRNRLDVPASYMWRYPTAYAGHFPVYPAYPLPSDAPTGSVTEPETSDTIADNEVIGPRTPVLSLEGEKVGTVSEVQVDEAGHLSHLVVDLGFLSDEKVLPAHWIETIDSNGVQLAVSNIAVESLETIT